MYGIIQSSVPLKPSYRRRRPLLFHPSPRARRSPRSSTPYNNGALMPSRPRARACNDTRRLYGIIIIIIIIVCDPRAAV
jgi:hypothetical protein